MSGSSVDDDTAASSVLARGLVEPAFASALRAGMFPRSSAHRRAARLLDAERLALFAGFITKVRYNNDLFEHLPETLRLLRHYGVEIAAFRDYYLSGASRSKTSYEKIAAALAHFEGFAKSSIGRKVTGLRDVLAHERVNWELRLELVGWRTQVAPPAVPFLNGPMRVIHTHRDPWLLIESVAAPRHHNGAECRPTKRLYWVDPNACEIRSTAIGARVAWVLAAVDGRRDLATIAAEMRQRRITPQRTFAIVASLVEVGVINILRESQ